MCLAGPGWAEENTPAGTPREESPGQRRFYLVDVFASERYAGNQLAVFMNGHLYSSEEMQRIAREFNFSEVTFFLPRDSREGAYKVRIFTPQKELPFAGHPTLGTAYVLLKHWVKEPRPQIALDLAVGRIPVRVEYAPRRGSAAHHEAETGQDLTSWEPQLLVMRQNPPELGAILARPEVAHALGLAAEDLDPRYPPQIVSTGLPFVIVPLQSLEAARRAWVQPAAHAALAEQYGCGDVLVFCPETVNPQARLHVRVFVPLLGIPEDPATGSGNGCLAAYLLQHGYLAGKDPAAGPLATEDAGPEPAVEIWTEQGVEMGRPSLLYLHAWRSGGEKEAGAGAALSPQRVDSPEAIAVEVGGRVVPVGWGALDP